MKNHLTLRYLAGMLLFTLACHQPTSNQDIKPEKKSVSLGFKPKAGDKKKIHYMFFVDAPSSHSSIQFEMELLAEITSVTAETATLQLAYKKICMHGKMKDKDMESCADSCAHLAPDAMMVATPVFSYLNSAFSHTYDAKMRVIQQSIIHYDSARFEQLESQESKVQFFSFLPGKTCLAGDTWTETVEIKAGMHNRGATRFTLVKTEDGIAEISFEGDIDISGELYGKQFTRKGTLKGKFTVDVKTGWLRSAEMNQDFILSMDGKDNPMNYKIKMNIE